MTKSIDPRERPGSTVAHDVEAGAVGTFPASDPPASTPTQGARAVPAEDMLRRPKPVADVVALQRRFPDAEAAKLALESLVRSVPLDRACTEISDGGELRVRVPRGDADRVEALLRSV